MKTAQLELEVPPNITKAAQEAHEWFALQGVERWELGSVCSRNHARLDLEARVKELENEKELLTQQAAINGDAWTESVSEAQDLLKQITDLQSQLTSAEATVERMTGENEQLREALRNIGKHQTEMGGSYNQWYNEVVVIAYKALSTPSPTTTNWRAIADELAEQLNICSHPSKEECPCLACIATSKYEQAKK